MIYHIVKFYFGIKALTKSIGAKPLSKIKMEPFFYGMTLSHYQLNHI